MKTLTGAKVFESVHHADSLDVGQRDDRVRLLGAEQFALVEHPRGLVVDLGRAREPRTGQKRVAA